MPGVPGQEMPSSVTQFQDHWSLQLLLDPGTIPKSQSSVSAHCPRSTAEQFCIEYNFLVLEFLLGTAFLKVNSTKIFGLPYFEIPNTILNDMLH